MNSTNYNPHIFALCSLFVVGNVFITNSFFNYGLWYALSCIFGFLVLLFFMTFLVINTQKSKAILYFVIAIVYPAAILGAVFTFLDFLEFLKAIQLPQTNIFLLSFVMIIVISAFLLSKNSTAYKYYLLVGVIGATLFIICFLGELKFIDFNNAPTLFKKYDLNTKDFIKTLFPVIVVPPFVFFNLSTPPIKSMVGGVLAGCFTLLLCFFQTCLSLGTVNDIAFPYLSAVGIISTSNLFTRLDGLVYFLFFVTSITKITVCLKTIFCILPQKIKKTFNASRLT